MHAGVPAYMLAGCVLLAVNGCQPPLPATAPQPTSVASTPRGPAPAAPEGAAASRPTQTPTALVVSPPPPERRRTDPRTLSWEATLVEGRVFELSSRTGARLRVTVARVLVDDTERVYELTWDGPAWAVEEIRVRGESVTVGRGVGLEAMAPPIRVDDGICYGQDLSRPDGCDDVCDASLCLAPTRGIVSVMGLYAPNHDRFTQRP